MVLAFSFNSVCVCVYVCVCVCVCCCCCGGGIFSTLSKYEKETRKQILVVVILSLNHIQVLASNCVG